MHHSILSHKSAKKLQHYIEQVLSGVDTDPVGEIADDPEITSEDLRTVLTGLCEEFNASPPHIEGKDKTELALLLVQTIGDFSALPQDLQAPGEVVVNPSSPNSDAFDNSGVHVESRRQSAIIKGGTANITNRILRYLRHKSGWKSLMTLHNGTEIPQTQAERLVVKLRQNYVDGLMKAGMTSEDAETATQRDYIALTQHSVATWTDLSPEAYADALKVHEITKNTIKPVSLKEICERWGLTGRQSEVASIVRDLRHNHITKLSVQKIRPREEIARDTDNSYISITHYPESGRHNYRIYPPAIPDIEEAIRQKFPHYKPKAPTAQSR